MKTEIAESQNDAFSTVPIICLALFRNPFNVLTSSKCNQLLHLPFPTCSCLFMYNIHPQLTPLKQDTLSGCKITSNQETVDVS